MAKSDKNVLLYDVERLNSRLIKHREIEHKSFEFTEVFCRFASNIQFSE